MSEEASRVTDAMVQVTGCDTRAQSFVELGSEWRKRLNDRLYESLRHAHQAGVADLSRRELRDYHQWLTGEFLELSSMASTVNALVAAGRLEEVAARPCSLPPHRLIKPVRCRAKQASL